MAKDNKKETKVKEQLLNELRILFSVAVEDSDEWGSVTVGNEVFDYHHLYDEDIVMYIYPVIDGSIECNEMFIFNYTKETSWTNQSVDQLKRLLSKGE